MPVRVLVIDDSAVVRRTLLTVLGEDPDIEVVGAAPDGRLGLGRIAEAQPDVVTLDVEMPVMSGIEALVAIRRDHPDLPVIMYSTLTERGAVVTLDALTLGAVDYATKPTGATDREAAAQQVREQLLPLVKLWGRRRLPRRTEPPAPAPRPTVLPTIRKPVDLVAIGVSTGGPDALTALLPRLPGNLPVPVVIVQHMPPVFTAMLAQRLDRRCELTVTEVTDPGPAEPGHVYLAPGGRHLAVQLRGGRLVLELNDDAPENSCRPAVDVLFRSAAAATDGRMLAAVLTGMGQDGLAGAEVVRRAGAEVIVQDEATSVVWSMPGVIARAGLASAVLPLAGVADAIAGRVRAFGRAPVVGRV